MLTLGLMEGIVAFVAITFVALIGLENNVPLHRLLGPPAAGLIGFVAWGAYEAGVSGADVAGLVAIGLFALVLPLAGLRWCWAYTRRGIEPVTVAERAPRTRVTVEGPPPGRVVVRPLARTRDRVGA